MVRCAKSRQTPCRASSVWTAPSVGVYFADVVANAPYFDTDIYDLSGLIRLGDKIWR